MVQQGLNVRNNTRTAERKCKERKTMKNQKLIIGICIALIAVGLATVLGFGISMLACNTDAQAPGSTETVIDEPVVDEPVVDEGNTDNDADNDAETEKVLHFSKNGVKTSDNGVMRKELTSLELVTLMGNGINLGNTMEACDNTVGNVTDDTSHYETYWGCPVTTQEAIDGMKAAGFDSIRIPVAWMTNATTLGKDGDYTISEAYLDRVEEIINYALNNDMYVILNDHWDGGWYGMFGSDDAATRELAMEAYKGMWKQIAERYAEYSDYLIFEGANEEIGARFDENSALYCEDSENNYLTTEETYALALEVNQAFVDTVRATGGNNADRFLLVPGYGTDITKTCDEQFIMPTDTADSKLLISVHYYDPSGYCIFASLPTWGTQKEHQAMADTLAMMEKFNDLGYGVVIGECGAIYLEDGQLKEGALEWTEHFLNICDLHNYCPVLWDTTGSFDRNAAKFRFDDLAKIFADHSYAAQAGIPVDELKASAQQKIDAAIAAAPAEAAPVMPEGGTMAWIMFTSNDWGIQYSVGDVYTPSSATAGIVVTDAEITGAGTYTVSLDFTGTGMGYADGTAFCALGIADGEILFPGYLVQLKEVSINGTPIQMTGRGYTTSDDTKCTRVNLYNSWVTAVPEGARILGGSLTGATPCLFDGANIGHIETISVTFEYIAPNN